ncbi:MAG: hypothetical protein E6K64_03545 [Nitrospirae bacterium]|nr:MAG: hypothetical protein E6K64_03545 [Nitrospirota bacterium]
MKALPPFLAVLLVLPISSFAQSDDAPQGPLGNSGFEDRAPEGMFSSIVMAHGQEMVMGQARSFQIVPVNPTKTFYADVPEIFVVFSLQQHDSEFKVYGRWVVERSEGVPPNHVLGTDAMILMTEDESGFVSLKRPKNGWPIGDYKVEIFTGTGSHDMSKVGTLRFQVLPAKASS